jgi:hypothetical protein
MYSSSLIQAQPGIFHHKLKSRQCSKSAGYISRYDDVLVLSILPYSVMSVRFNRAKNEGTYLMETSAKILMEQVNVFFPIDQL